MKKVLLAVCALLMATLAVAQNETVVINNTTPGKLAQTLGGEVYTITNLKVTGSINSDDVATLRKMAGFMPENVPSDWAESGGTISDWATVRCSICQKLIWLRGAKLSIPMNI